MKKWICGFLLLVTLASILMGAAVVPRLIVEESDGSPSGQPATLKVTNGTLTDNGDGTFSVTTGGGSSSSLEVIVGTTRSSSTATEIFNSSQFSGSVSGSTITISLVGSSVTLQGQNVIRLTNSLQSGATFYVSSGTVDANFRLAYALPGGVFYSSSDRSVTVSTTSLYFDSTNSALFAGDATSARVDAGDGSAYSMIVSNGDNQSELLVSDQSGANANLVVQSDGGTFSFQVQGSATANSDQAAGDAILGNGLANNKTFFTGTGKYALVIDPASGICVNCEGVSPATALATRRADIHVGLSSRAPSIAQSKLSLLSNKAGDSYAVYQDSDTGKQAYIGIESGIAVIGSTSSATQVDLRNAGATVATVFASSVNVTGVGGLGVTYGITAGTVTPNNLTASRPVKSDANKMLVSGQIDLSSTNEITSTLGVANGGTNLTAAADDNVMVGNGTTWQSKAVGSCSGASNALTYNTSSNAFGCNTISSGGSSLAVTTGSASGFSAITSSPTAVLNFSSTTFNVSLTGSATAFVTLTLPLTFTYKAAVCQNTTASLGFSTYLSSGPTAACFTNAQTTLGIASFTDASTQEVQDHFSLPNDWTGSVDVAAVWKSTQTSGNVVWQIKTACVAAGESLDPSWNTASTVTDAAQGTSNRANTAALSSITTTGCAAGEEFFFNWFRNPADASDTLAGTADLISLQFTIRRATQ